MLDVSAPPVTRAPAVQRSLYRAVWRWHFYAGLLAIPVIVILSLSGIVYLFKPQLNSLLYGDLVKVPAAATSVPFAQQLDTVKARYPDATIGTIFTPDNPRRSTQIDLTAPGKDLSVFVNPHTGQLLGARNNGHDPARIALELHGSLMTGKWLHSKTIGDRFIELVAGWTVVLVITGLYLWWPRKRRDRTAGARRDRLRGVLTIRRRTGNPRLFWRDLHAVTGVLFSFVLMFFLVTGMAWTGYWGAKFSSAANSVDGYTKGSFSFSAQSTPPTTVGELLPDGRSPWAAGLLPLAPSQPPPAPPTGSTPVTMDAVLNTARAEGMTGSLAVVPPSDSTGSWFVGRYSDTDGAPNRSSLDDRISYVDQYSAQPIETYRYADYGATGKAYDTGIALHEGREWGLASQLLALLGVLAILVSVASSLVMWRKRRPRGLGAPRKEPDRRVGLGVLAIMAGLGVLFPLVGLSMVLLLTAEFFVLRRIPPVARALGLEPSARTRAPDATAVRAGGTNADRSV
jgi:uncharacterized iron-regulated membrane protein